MKLGLLADIHSNLEALQVCLNVLKNEGVDGYLILGDMIGYGPFPNECLDVIRQLPATRTIVGNHDWAAVDLEDIELFNEDAKQAILWTKTVLTPDNQNFLTSLEYSFTTNIFMMVHGSPRDPLDEYLLNAETFAENLEDLKANICFVGHTHLPLYFYRDRGTNQMNSRALNEQEELVLDKSIVQMLNPGSVGQPRDRDPRASFAIFDTENLKFKLMRKEYNIAIIQEEMKKKGLPEFLSSRLSEGR